MIFLLVIGIGMTISGFVLLIWLSKIIKRVIQDPAIFDNDDPIIFRIMEAVAFYILSTFMLFAAGIVIFLVFAPLSVPIYAGIILESLDE